MKLRVIATLALAPVLAGATCINIDRMTVVTNANRLRYFQPKGGAT